MKLGKRILPLLLAGLLAFGMTACNGNTNKESSSSQPSSSAPESSAPAQESSSEGSSEVSQQETNDSGYENQVELSWYKEGITGQEINYEGDAWGQYWQDKFNVKFDLTAATMDDSDWNERLRIWINSGDMPDVAHWGFNYGELADYANQEAIYRFPDDWKERWPNVAKTQSFVPGAAVAEENLGGTYVLFRSILVNNRPAERLSYHAMLYMRRSLTNRIPAKWAASWYPLASAPMMFLRFIPALCSLSLSTLAMVTIRTRTASSSGLLLIPVLWRA